MGKSEAWIEKTATNSFEKVKTQFQTNLINWFKASGRDLPWRKTKNPYFIWISEIMLQQTQVDRVIDYFNRFTKKYPTVETLAKTSEEEGEKAWEGLGYYARARNLVKSAQIIVNDFNGEFPRTKDEITALPGIGDYTAGAIMTFGLGLPAPIVDTNVERVYSRVFFLSEKWKPSEKQKVLWHLAEILLPEEEFWEYNQGIMDLGATICTAFKPLCSKCPMNKICRYHNASSLLRFVRKEKT